MAFTEADLLTLRTAMASGIKRVTFADGRTTEYQNADAMTAAYKLAKAEVDMAATVASGRTRRRFAVFGTGF